jgi:hypothetical protein
MDLDMDIITVIIYCYYFYELDQNMDVDTCSNITDPQRTDSNSPSTVTDTSQLGFKYLPWHILLHLQKRAIGKRGIPKLWQEDILIIQILGNKRLIKKYWLDKIPFAEHRRLIE